MRRVTQFASLVVIVFLTALVADPARGQDSSAPTYAERYRPQIHFTPAENWMNDPNGMVYYNGEYHLFYQHNPFGNTWGHMSWGHAVSRDLVHWEHLPVALAEEDSVMIFSGSAVVDWNNTSGLGSDDNPPMVAIYTGHHTDQPLQDQRIAYSLDSGRTWTKYDGNPVIDIGMADFRDPKVLWYEPEEKWVMVLALPHERQVRFYESENLIDWQHLSDFGPAGALGGIWECPDLFPLPVDGHAERTKWVLNVDLNPGAPAGGSGGQYFIGTFDGTTFTADEDLTPAAALPEGEVVFGFEGGYDGWDVTGEAFGDAPAEEPLGDQRPIIGQVGGRFVNSFRGGSDEATGTLTSPAFAIEGDYLNLLIGGGSGEGTRVELLVDDKPVRTARGADSEVLDWATWDVTGLSGQEARLHIVDESTEGWGHILADHLMQSDEAAMPSVERANWMDYGADFYAGVSWSDIPEADGRRLMIAWMNNWLYANDIPTAPWRSAQSLPRRVALRTVGNSVELVHRPVVELRQLRRAQRHLEDLEIAEDTVALGEHGIAGKLLEIVAEFEVGDAEEVGLAVRRGDGGEETLIGYDTAAEEVFVDRTNAGEDDFHPDFAARHGAPLEAEDGRVTLHVFVDWSSVEVFAEEGRRVLTDRIFPDPASEGVALYAKGGAARLVSLDAWTLDSAWRPDAASRAETSSTVR